VEPELLENFGLSPVESQAARRWSRQRTADNVSVSATEPRTIWRGGGKSGSEPRWTKAPFAEQIEGGAVIWLWLTGALAVVTVNKLRRRESWHLDVAEGKTTRCSGGGRTMKRHFDHCWEKKIVTEMG